ncbi:outer membrane lipoprotein carrier protein LolA [Chrysiogenes arsenatis]|uniref:outer membrane lipoprotein carrier protein LolA n=1 Tax=Chrysiogenes arsenatis TaxID=309797 RepID=UPI00135F1A61|nr:outer membrane lipoprotein carrier protein LolA [Chrysiogenes arsenatis]
MIVVSVATPVVATEPPLFQELRLLAGEISTLTSAFTQEKKLSLFEHTVRSSGTINYQQPDCIRWELTHPHAVGFALCGQQGVKWNDDVTPPENFQSETDPMRQMVAQQLLIWFRGDYAQIQKQYTIAIRQSHPAILHLTPRRADPSNITSITVIFAEGNRSLAEMTLLDADGDSTRVVYHDTVLNSALQQGIFRQREVE